ncbi:hypothetical protein D046_5585B, partial [Vibrio parahaemolyticus V-223/04]
RVKYWFFILFISKAEFNHFHLLQKCNKIGL